MSTATVNRITVSYDDAGSSENSLLLVHGHPFDRSMWRPQVRGLDGSDWRVIVPDLRGYGQSSAASGKVTLDVFAQDMAALLDRLGVRHVVIGGLSMGGQIVMEFCRLYPERVRGIILAATSPQAETDEGKRKRNAMADRLLREGMGLYAQEVLPMMMAPANISALPAVAAHVLSMMRAAHPLGAAAALRGRAERPAYEDTLASLNVPALVVVGDQDAFTSRADAQLMHALLKGSELVWMEGVGHMPNLESTVEFNAALNRFLTNVMLTSRPATTGAGRRPSRSC